MRTAMVGSGYVGLVSGACFADFGHTVICVDLDEKKIAALTAGRVPIYEPGLDQFDCRQPRVRPHQLHHRATSRRSLMPMSSSSRSGRRHDEAMVTLISPLSMPLRARSPRRWTVSPSSSIKSTVPVGTGDEVKRIIRETNPKADFAVVSNPEFLREGAAIEDFKRPDRIVIGLEDERARDVMAEVYRPLYLNQAPILFTERRTAELIKYAANAFLAMKITFINEIADLSEAVGANVQDVARGIELDNRIGAKFLHPGPGLGGSCFPKDTLALIKTAQDQNTPVRLIETTVAVNDARKRAMARRAFGLDRIQAECWRGGRRSKARRMV